MCLRAEQLCPLLLQDAPRIIKSVFFPLPERVALLLTTGRLENLEQFFPVTSTQLL